MIFGYFILIIAVVISAIAAYYSVVGLAAIFAAAVIPVMIMGGALEAGKIVATVWLHNNWQRAGAWFKIYLVPAIIFLMVLTSMGIFGFLSKAHSDQSLVSGDSQAKIAIYDEKIKTARENIEANRKQLKQMDEAVDQVMGRSTDEKGADKANYIRQRQLKERAALARDIEANQKLIIQLNEEAAPLRAENRKIEADVGPIKYIAALIYGDNPDQNLLEAAVRWVIILIVVVFDPLALTLILAGNKQLEWARAGKGGWIRDEEPEEEHVPPENTQGFSFFEFEKKPEESPEPIHEEPKVEEPVKETCFKCGTELMDAPGIGPFCPNKECDVIDNVNNAKIELKIATEAQAVDTANELLADIPIAEPELDIIAADAEHIAALEAKQEETQSALDTLVEKYNELAAEKDSLIEDKDVLQSRLDKRQLELVAAQSDNATLAQAVVEIERELLAAETTADQLRQRIEELERALESEAVLQEPEMASDVAELETLQVEFNELMSLEEEPAPEPDIELVERPGDYLVVSDKDLAAYNDERLVSRFDKEDLVKKAPVVGSLGHGIQNSFAMMQEQRNVLVPDYEDNIAESGVAGFGIRFPESARKGDMFLRVDMIPNRAYKYNGLKWIETDKNKTDRFAYDQAYIQHLNEGLASGEYDLDDLNDIERDQIEQYRKSTL